MANRDDDKFSGLDALEEVTRRLRDLSQLALDTVAGAPGEQQKHFTIGSPRGPIQGVMGVTVRNLADIVQERSGRPQPKARPRRAQGVAPQPTRAIDLFEEESGFTVIIDAQGEDDMALAAELAGHHLVLRRIADGSIFETVELPRDASGHYAALQITNGIIEVKIARLTGA